MKLSSRNQIKGNIVDVVKGPVMTKVKSDIGGVTALPPLLLEMPQTK